MEAGSELEEGWAEETRDWASAMTASARWRDCWRTEVLDSRVELRVFREEISPWRVVIAAWRECDWEVREWAADSEWAMFAWRVSVRALETAWRRASFSGFGGMGGAGPVGVKEGRSSSKGDVNRSSAAGFGCRGGCWLAGTV